MLVLPAQLTHAEAPACGRMLAQAIRAMPAGSGVAVADASALQQFDSSALAVLLDCRREALAAGLQFAVTGLPERLHALATLYGVADLLPVPAAR